MGSREPTLQVIREGKTVFTSFGKWLYPLFELEGWFRDGDVDPAGVTVRDNIVGKAAAFLLVRMGIRHVEAGVLSRLGEHVLKSHRISYTCDELVERVMCRTEQMLQDVEDPHEAYALLKKRAKKD